jgi:hypothetical protein
MVSGSRTSTRSILVIHDSKSNGELGSGIPACAPTSKVVRPSTRQRAVAAAITRQNKQNDQKGAKRKGNGLSVLSTQSQHQTEQTERPKRNKEKGITLSVLSTQSQHQMQHTAARDLVLCHWLVVIPMCVRTSVCI